jgi:hypothetical protein
MEGRWHSTQQQLTREGKGERIMETKKYGMGPATRLAIGATVLEGALQVDTKLVKSRLNAFAAVHRSYVGAQGTVETLKAIALALDVPPDVLMG